MTGLRVSLFGKFSIRSDEFELQGFEVHKVQELLSYLLLHRGHSYPREEVASVLWADTTTSQSRRYLRKALWQLQSALKCNDRRDDHSSAPHCTDSLLLEIEEDWIRLTPGPRLCFDVAIFEHAYEVVRGVPGRQLDAPQRSLLMQAIEIYRGRLLQGWYQDWCLYERERLQDMYVIMLDKLMGYCEIGHEYELGLIYGAKILALDRAREVTYRQLMRLLYLSGDRTSALRQYERCVEALRQELDVAPDSLTIALYEAIRADRRDALNGEKPDAPLLRSQPLATLAPLGDTLIELQSQLRKAIENIQATLERIE